MANQHSFREGRTMVVGAIRGGEGGALGLCVAGMGWLPHSVAEVETQKPFSTFEITAAPPPHNARALSGRRPG